MCTDRNSFEDSYYVLSKTFPGFDFLGVLNYYHPYFHWYFFKIPMEIRMINFWIVINVSCVTLREKYFSKNPNTCSNVASISLILLLIHQNTCPSYFNLIPYPLFEFTASKPNSKWHSPRLTSYTMLWTVLVSSWVHCLPHCMANIGIKKDLTKLSILLLTDLLFYSIHTYIL